MGTLTLIALLPLACLAIERWGLDRRIAFLTLPKAESADDVLRFGRLEIDLGARVARLSGQPCDLTSHQFDLLVVLAVEMEEFLQNTP